MPLAGLRGRHAVGLAALLLGILAVRATEVYTGQYQTLPVLDWLASRPPLAESNAVPAAADLARGVARVQPLLSMTDDVQPLLPIFGPPGMIQRTMGGVRDAARLYLSAPPLAAAAGSPVQLRLDAIVFYRRSQASAWYQLLSGGQAMDFRDPENGLFQVRLSGPDDTDGVWLAAPKENSRVATVAGTRGSVAFELQVTCQRSGADSPEDQLDLSARAETMARQTATAWTHWLEGQLPSA